MNFRCFYKHLDAGYTHFVACTDQTMNILLVWCEQDVLM